MSTQSSATTLFRGLVMLACLVVIPGVALFGTALPEAVKQALQQRLGITLGGNMASAAPASPLAAFVPAAAASNSNSGFSPTLGPMGASPASKTLNPPPAFIPPSATPAEPLGTLAQMQAARDRSMAVAIPAVLETSLNSPAPAADRGIAPAAFHAPIAESASASSSPGPKKSLEQMALAWSRGEALETRENTLPAAQPDLKRGSLAASAGGMSQPGAATGDRFMQVHRRLRELGASYSLLETWGAQGQLYRYHCKMAMGGSSNYTRHFEATDPDPVGAMNRVLEKVEAWKSGRN